MANGWSQERMVMRDRLLVFVYRVPTPPLKSTSLTGVHGLAGLAQLIELGEVLPE